MRLFGSEKIMSMFNALGVQDGEQIEHKMLTSAIEKAQKKIEGNNYGIRENVLKYDEVMNEQREIIYKERRQVLDGESMKDVILKMIRDIVSQVVDRTISDEQAPEDWDFTQLNIELRSIIPLTEYMPSADETKNMKKAALKETLTEMALQAYADKESEFPDPESMREAERVVLLKTIDRKWMDHIDDMDQLRQGIGLQAYAQRDPLNEYKMAGYEVQRDDGKHP